MIVEGKQFKNSSACAGVSYTSTEQLDLAEITITARYPETGWARNLETHEMVKVLDGEGSLELKDEDVTMLVKGDVVNVPPKQWFAWNGTMTVLMACSPAFDPKQYEIEEAL